MKAALSSEIHLLDASDAPWIGSILDLVERSLGEPWRVLLERIEHAPLRASRARVGMIVGALRRVLGGRTERARVARRLRGLVLGHPALDREARAARIDVAVNKLGISAADVEELLWADLAKERPVMLPEGRPPEGTLAAFANLDRIQRAVRRAREVRLRVWGDAHDLVRTAARYGLLSRISRGADGETIIDVTGPLALFHATTVYGRTLAALVPLVAAHERFTLDLHCDFSGHARILHVETPTLLPPAPVPRRRKPSVAEHLARDLRAMDLAVMREPTPIVVSARLDDGVVLDGPAGDQLLFPDLLVEVGGVTWSIEVIGFSTADYLEHKRASYRAAGIQHLVLCIDDARSQAHAKARGCRVPQAAPAPTPAPPAPPPPPLHPVNTVWFKRWIDAEEVLGVMAGNETNTAHHAVEATMP